jgi:hypothetical protein
MSTKFFNGFTDSLEARQAIRKYCLTPFMEVLTEARSGNSQALLYLVVGNIKAISYAFKRYQSFSRESRNNTEIENISFLTDFYMHLIEATKKGTGPIHSFNNLVFDNQDSEFLMKKFSYRMFRYAQFILVQDAKKNKKRRELVTNSSDMSTINKDGTIISPYENIEDPSVLILDLSSEFADTIKRSKSKYLYTVFIGLVEGKDALEIATELNLCKESVYQRVRRIKSMYKEYMNS